MDMRPNSGNAAQRVKPSEATIPGQAPDSLVTPLQQFFATSAVACPYVDGRAERKLIVELAGREAVPFYDVLSHGGFRRSHRYAYRPACRECSACVPVRISAARFVWTRSSRRLAKLNADLVVRFVPPEATKEQFQLFVQYQRLRHGDSDMAGMSYGDYRAMVEDTPVRTELAELRDAAGRLAAVSLIDLLSDGISAVYSFYDPLQASRSLGTWSVLSLVGEAQRRDLAYVYLGYWISESEKMAYKARFNGLETLVGARWTPLVSPP